MPFWHMDSLASVSLDADGDHFETDYQSMISVSLRRRGGIAYFERVIIYERF